MAGTHCIRKGDNNYSISIATFGYNPRLMIQHWILHCFAAKTTTTGGVLQKKLFKKILGNFKGKHLYWSLFLIKLHSWGPAALLKETLTQVFSCEIFKNIYFEEYLWTTYSKNQYVTKKIIHRFLLQNYDFHNYYPNLWGLKFLLSFYAVFANLFHKNIRSFLLCKLHYSELIE